MKRLADPTRTRGMEFKVSRCSRVVLGQDLTPWIEWLKRGGLAGRGILLDYASWAEHKGIKYRPDSTHKISEKDLDEVANWQGSEFLPGDMLFVRTGWIKWYNESSDAERVQGCKVNHNYCGIEGTASSIEWLWNHHFSALVADNMAFEAWPAQMPYRESTPSTSQSARRAM